jgi:hypothetical protein
VNYQLKKTSSNVFSLNFTNLLNERYEKPATYSQDGRHLKLVIQNYTSYFI